MSESFVSCGVLILALLASLLLTPNAWILSTVFAAMSIILAGMAVVRGNRTAFTWLGNGLIILVNIALIAVVLPIW